MSIMQATRIIVSILYTYNYQIYKLVYQVQSSIFQIVPGPAAPARAPADMRIAI